jgi:hypothetical protein
MPRITGRSWGTKVTPTGRPAARDASCSISATWRWFATLYACTFPSSSAKRYLSSRLRPAPETPDLASTITGPGRTSPARRNGSMGSSAAVT